MPNCVFIEYSKIHTKILNDKNIIAIFGVIGQNFGPVDMHCLINKPEDHWSCIAQLSAEDMLKSAVIAEKKFKHSLRAGADNPLGPKVLCQQEGLITKVVCCKFKKNLFSL